MKNKTKKAQIQMLKIKDFHNRENLARRYNPIWLLWNYNAQ
jgi:hypothetical protein